MSQAVQCQNCGAMMQPASDGRLYHCPYCKTQVQVGIGGDQIAAGLGIDLHNAEAVFARLAQALGQGFAERSQIKASGAQVVSLEVNLDPDVFLMHREGNRPVTSHKKVVRGVALRTKALPLDVWFNLLTEALAHHANENARAGWVLSQIGGRR